LSGSAFEVSEPDPLDTLPSSQPQKLVERLGAIADLAGPGGWIQVFSAAQAIELLDGFTVHELSLPAGPRAEHMIDWLIEQRAAGRDVGPTEPVVLHRDRTAPLAAT
jgi:hypothetical protein